MCSLKKESREKMRNKTGPLLKTILIEVICISLVIHPLAYANDQMGAVVNQLATSINQTGQMMQSMNAQMNAMNQQLSPAEMQALSPKVMPAMYFPHCKVPLRRSAFNETACSTLAPGDMGGLQKVYSYMKLANTNKNFYEDATSLAQNTQTPVGLQCLHKANDRLMTQIQDKLNFLENKITEMNKKMQLFKAQNQAIISEMDDISGDLDGGTTSNKSRDVNKYFQDDACKQALSSVSFRAQDGLRTVVNTLTEGNKSLGKSAQNLLHDKKHIERGINTQIKRLQNKIAKTGIDSLDKGVLGHLTSGGLTKFRSMGEIIKRKRADLEEIKGRSQKKFTQLGLNKSLIPEFDKHFNSNISKFEKKATYFFKQSFVNNCVTASGGLGLTNKDVLGGLRQKGVKRGTTVRAYRKALQAILESQAYIDKKIQSIAALDKKFNNAIIITLDTSTGNKTMNPNTLYRKTIKRCEKKYQENSLLSPLGRSVKQEVAEAKKYIAEIKEAERNFSTDLVRDIKNDILNCGDRAVDSSSSCNGKDALEPTSKNFCLKAAVTCANNIESCVARARSLVKDREQNIKVRAHAFNKNVRDLITSQELYLKQIKNQVFADMEWFKKYFPNSAYSLKENLFVKMPELAKSGKHGVELLGAGNLAALLNQSSSGSFPKQVKKLQAMLQAQKEDINSAVGAYIKKQKKVMKNNRKKWVRLFEKCQATATKFNSDMAAMKQAQNQAEKEGQAKVQEFCSKYGGLGPRGPGPGCDGDYSASTLTGEAMAIAGQLNPSVMGNLREYESLCRTIGEQEDEMDGDESKKYPLLKMCKDNDDWGSVKAELTSSVEGISDDEVKEKVAKQLEKIPEFDDIYKKKLIKKIGDKVKELGGELNGFQRDVVDKKEVAEREKKNLQNAIKRAEQILKEDNRKLVDLKKQKKALTPPNPEIAKLEIRIEAQEKEIRKIETAQIERNEKIVEQNSIIASAQASIGNPTGDAKKIKDQQDALDDLKKKVNDTDDICQFIKVDEEVSSKTCKGDCDIDLEDEKIDSKAKRSRIINNHVKRILAKTKSKQAIDNPWSKVGEGKQTYCSGRAGSGRQMMMPGGSGDYMNMLNQGMYNNSMGR